jgi:parallel beta-helix repeat protein
VNGNAFTDTSAGVGNGFGIEVRSSVDTGQVIDNTVTHAKAPGIVVAGTGFTVSSNTFTP